MKKFFAITLAVILTVAMCLTAISAYAEETTAPATAGSEQPSITISNAVEGQTYSIYKIMNLEASEGFDAFIYTATDEWSAFLNSDEIKGKYINIAANGTITWVADADAAEFAKLALDYAKANSISATATDTCAEGADSVVFTGLDLGYYLIDSSLGALCGLDTTTPNGTVYEKNDVPTINKQVKEGDEWQKANDANVGSTVNFYVVITAKAGAENYTLHDKMSAGLTFTGITEVKYRESGEENSTVVDPANYTVITNGEDGDTFCLTFSQTFLDTVGDDDKIGVYYTATLNENAVVDGDGNDNEATLTYGDDNSTTTSTTKTYTWEIPIFKYTTKNGTETPLAGAKFVLSYKNAQNETKYAVTDGTANNLLTGWVDSIDDATRLVSGEDGNVKISGLDSRTYSLTEVEAPAGYNMLSAPLSLTVNATLNNANNTMAKTITYKGATVSTIKVENNTGTELPSTGGIGTTIFYVVGAILVVGAVVFFVVRKRMNAENNK